MTPPTARMIGALIAGLSSLPVASKPVEPRDLVESIAFLESYRTAGSAQSPDFFELYTDRAVVHLRTQTPEQEMTIAGGAFKRWGRELLASGRTALDASVFHEATVEQRGHRLVIRAKRYSISRCYWDLAYLMGIERQGVDYRIVEERLTMNPSVSCKPHLLLQAVQPTISLAPVNPMTSASSGGPFAGATVEPEWHPLSSSDLSAKALILAEQAVARRASSSTGTIPPRVAPLAAPAPLVAQQRDGALEVRITPQESP